ncbi:hypothetical protein GCM10009678_77930 [Actinomadura kijaniata]|uniref:Uncharacterized protein n=1 Tax=Actinomadura namibiensis TaxID=182080 RepID=A0A7W3LVI6_ACTNM|nr:hypothetical protein [Actinomadura namibiensis]MBA8955026.1 hypothetical protein [Actinomadura namibiensis]
MIGRFGVRLGDGRRRPVRDTLLRLTPARLLVNDAFLKELVGWTPPPAPVRQAGPPAR